MEIVRLDHGSYAGSFKLNNRHARKRCAVYSALVIKKVRLMKVSAFMILGFKLPFSVLFSIEEIVGKVPFLTLLEKLRFLMLVRTS